MAEITNTAKGRYYKVYKDGAYVSQHTTEREALEVCTNLVIVNPSSIVKYVHEYEVEVKWDSEVANVSIIMKGPQPPNPGTEEQPDFIVTSEAEFDTMMANIQPGQLAVIEDGTYNRRTLTTRNGTQANPIRIEARLGHENVVFTPTGNQEFAVISHPYWRIGKGISYVGTNPGSQGAPASGQPGTGLTVASSNSVFKGSISRTQTKWIHINNGLSNIRLEGITGFLTGTYSTGGAQPDDPGNGVLTPEGGSSSNILLYNSQLQNGGHSLFQFKDNVNVRFQSNLFTNNWAADVYGEGTNKGNRAGTFNGVTNLVMRDCLAYDIRLAVDNPGNQTMKTGVTDSSLALTFMLDNLANGTHFINTSNTQNPEGYSDCYYDHITFHISSDNAFERNDRGGAQAGPINIKNCIFSDLAIETGNVCIRWKYDGGLAEGDPRRDWRENLFVDGILADADYTVQIQLQGGTVNGTKTDFTESFPLSQANSRYPNNFGPNIFIQDPQFVSEALPTSKVAATALAQAKANFIPQSTNARSSVALTTLTSAPVASQTFTVLDGGWLRGAYVDNLGDDIPGDVIFIEGAGSRTITSVSGNTITVNQSVTAANGSRIWRGTTNNPRIGAVL